MSNDTTTKLGTVHKTPVVVKTAEIADFIQCLIRRAVPRSRLVICAEEEDFLHQVLASLSFVQNNDEASNDGEADFNHTSERRQPTRRHPLLIKTLRQIYNSRNINVTFCPSIDVLRAFLASYGRSELEGKEDKESSTTNTASVSDASFLVLLNPLALHSGTPNFSAQGLSRTFASAVDAAFAVSQRLIITECPSRVRTRHVYEHDDHEIHDASSPIGDEDEDIDPWDQDIPLLNSTTRSFGAGSRAWAGRTVTPRQVVARWCVSEDWPAEKREQIWY